MRNKKIFVLYRYIITYIVDSMHRELDIDHSFGQNMYDKYHSV